MPWRLTDLIHRSCFADFLRLAIGYGSEVGGRLYALIGNHVRFIGIMLAGYPKKF